MRGATTGSPTHPDVQTALVSAQDVRSVFIAQQQQQRVQVLLPAEHTSVRELFSFRGGRRPLLTAPCSPPFRVWRVAKYYSTTASRTAAAARRRPLCAHIPRRASRSHKPGASRLGSGLDCDSNCPSDYFQFLRSSGAARLLLLLFLSAPRQLPIGDTRLRRPGIPVRSLARTKQCSAQTHNTHIARHTHRPAAAAAVRDKGKTRNGIWN